MRPKGAAALLHREGESHLPRSTQRNSNRRGTHATTEGSCGSAAQEGGSPSDVEYVKKFKASDGGTLTASEGSCGSATPERRVPLAAECKAWFDASDGGLSLQLKGACSSAAPGGRARPTQSMQRNSRRRTEGVVALLAPEGRAPSVDGCANEI
ncbi:hypothetical protein ROHU_023603 [Labeo rohita]|uniref:Uncharacterized protein n=1 Tax=Labeo rohita TaxID=84645 RepID=A0A498MV62_LABRO|nr:hypothetical protein ROHU_023603 [Labeo rohita]